MCWKNICKSTCMTNSRVCLPQHRQPPKPILPASRIAITSTSTLCVRVALLVATHESSFQLSFYRVILKAPGSTRRKIPRMYCACGVCPLGRMWRWRREIVAVGIVGKDLGGDAKRGLRVHVDVAPGRRLSTHTPSRPNVYPQRLCGRHIHG